MSIPIERVIDRSKTPEDQDLPAVPCLVCGKETLHINDGGDAWLVNALVEGKELEFLCHRECYTKDIWRCGCVSDYIENIGTHCVACKKPREQASPFPGSCLVCSRGDALISDAKYIHETVQCECLKEGK